MNFEMEIFLIIIVVSLTGIKAELRSIAYEIRELRKSNEEKFPIV